MVVSRMPTCMRRHGMGTGTETTKVEVYQVPSGAFVIRSGKRLYATETQTCESFAKMESEPVEGIGKLMGTFRVKKGELIFEKAEAQDEAASAEK